MGRIIAIDWGTKRSGLAVTDVLRIIPGGLGTVPTHQLFDFLESYIKKEVVDIIVVGYPKNMNGEDSASFKFISPFVKKLEKIYPDKEIVLFDERFTSVIAHRVILESGIGKMARRNKSLVDEISATIILESYLESKK